MGGLEGQSDTGPERGAELRLHGQLDAGAAAVQEGDGREPNRDHSNLPETSTRVVGETDRRNCGPSCAVTSWIRPRFRHWMIQSRAGGKGGTAAGSLIRAANLREIRR